MNRTLLRLQHARSVGAVAAATLALATLSGCASLAAGDSAAPAPVATPAPAAWQTPLPHQGELTDLTRWWAQFDDPLLARLIDSAQSVSGSVSSAGSRIAQSRATRVAAGAALGPSLSADASAVRGSNSSGGPSPASSLAAGLNAAWELDLFGGNAAARNAAQARLEGAQMQWHEARVSVAAEVAAQYTSLRACEAQLAQVRLDSASRAETARLTSLSAKAGFQPPANAALSRASAAQGNSQATQQAAQCDSLVKGLVALTGSDEPSLRSALAARSGVIAQPAAIGVPAVPAALLRQRPDLGNAERELLAASFDTTQAQAARLPRVSLNGSIGAARVSAGGLNNSDSTWSLGPISVSLPLFDGGTRRANVVAARARHADATVQYNARLRGAVREVEDALLALQSTAARSVDAQAAAEGFAFSLRATDARFKGGLASLFELEDARRSAVLAQTTLIDLQRERVAAWIALYRALGGGWSDADSQFGGSGSAEISTLAASAAPSKN